MVRVRDLTVDKRHWVGHFPHFLFSDVLDHVPKAVPLVPCDTEAHIDIVIATICTISGV